MLFMVTVTHTAADCPARDEQGVIVPCLNTMTELLTAKGITATGRWADPAAHINYMLLDAPAAHAIQEALMESGLFRYTTSEIRPVLSMD